VRGVKERLLYRFLLLAPLLPGCVYTAEQGRLLESRVQQLSAQNGELKQQLDAQQAQLDATLNGKVAEVTKALASLDQASRRSGADIGVQLQKTIEDVAQLRGQVDSYQHSIAEISDKVDKLQGAANQKAAELQSEQARRDADAKVVRPTDKRAFYALAQEKLKVGDGELGQKLLREFVKKWPKDDLAGEAYFSLGETYFAQKSCEQALPEFGKVVEEYPKAKSAPVALLRSADCFKSLGKPAESKLALEEVLKSYPKSDEVKAAKVKLADLARASRKGAKKPSP
jgi:tol-pal system protein YbgF